MKIRTLAIGLLFMLMMSSTVVAQLKIGYMNPQEVLSKLPEVTQIEQQVSDFVAERDQELAQEAATIQQQIVQYQETRESLTPEQQQAQEDRLLQLNTDFEGKRSAFQQEIAQRRSQLLQPVINKVNVAMEAVAKEMGLDMVLSQATSLGDSIIYFASDPTLNITDKVVAKVLEP